MRELPPQGPQWLVDLHLGVQQVRVSSGNTLADVELTHNTLGVDKDVRPYLLAADLIEWVLSPFVGWNGPLNCEVL